MDWYPLFAHVCNFPETLGNSTSMYTNDVIFDYESIKVVQAL